MTTKQSTAPKDHWKITDEEMEIAKGTDLLDLLSHLAYQVRRVGRYSYHS